MVEASFAVRAGFGTPCTRPCARADPLGRHRQRRQDAERLEGHLVGRVGTVEVVELPQRLEAERLGIPASSRSGPAPPAASRRTRPSSPGGPSARPSSSPRARVQVRPTGSGGVRSRPTPVRPARRAGRTRTGAVSRPAYHRCHEQPSIPGYDPERPLTGPPEPWHWAEQPIDRGAPPWFMTEMILAEPAFAERCLARLASDGSAVRLAEALRGAAERARRSPSSAAAPASTGRSGPPRSSARPGARPACPDAGSGRRPGVRGVAGPGRRPVIGVSHDGGTWATNQALAAARTAGAARR